MCQAGDGSGHTDSESGTDMTSAAKGKNLSDIRDIADISCVCLLMFCSAAMSLYPKHIFHTLQLR